MSDSVLASWLVDITPRGLDATKAAIDAVKPSLDAGAAAVESFGYRLSKGWHAAKDELEKHNEALDAAKRKSKEMSDAVSGIGTKTKLAIAGATASVLGFVRAGMQGTTHGERLSLTFQLLNREIGSVFVPTIEQVIRGVEKATSWLGKLDGAGQNQARRMLEGVAAAGVMAAILPKVTSAVTTLSLALRGVGAGAGLGGLTALTSFGTGLLMSSKEGRQALLELANAVKPMLSAIQPLAANLASMAASIAGAVTPVIKGLASVMKTLGTGGTLVLVGLIALHKKFGITAVTSFASAGTAARGFGNTLKSALGSAQVKVGLLMAAIADLKTLADDFTSGEKGFGESAHDTFFGGAVNSLVKLGGKAGIKTVGGSDEDVKGFYGDLNRWTGGFLGEKRRPSKEEEEQRRSLQLSAGQYESADQTYRRISSVAMKTADPNQKTADNTSGILDVLKRMLADAQRKQKLLAP